MAKSLGDKFKDALKQGVDKASGSSINDFSKAVDNLYRNVSGVANLFRGSELVSTLLVRDQLSSTVFSSSTGWQIKGDGTATFRNVTISGGSLLITNTTDRIHLQSDGDALFGSDISAPATTSFSIFSNAQTYNSESMGAGDVLFGDNSSGKANLLWDASAGKILLRGGTTTQGYYDTDGAAVFGGGTVTLDTSGVTIDAGVSQVNWLKWYDSTDGVIADIYAYLPSGAGKPSLQIDVGQPSTSSHTQSQIVLTATTQDYNAASNNALLTIANKAAVGGISLMSFRGIRDGATAYYFDIQRGGPFTWNYEGGDLDFVVEGDTATNLLVCDAGLDAVQIGTTTAGVILDARSTGVIINDAGASTIDFTVEGDTETQLLFVDASEDKVYYKGSEIGVAGAGGVSIWQVQMFS